MNNKYIILITFIATSLVFGCRSDFLDEDALSFYTDENFYTSPDGMDRGVISMYAGLYNTLIGDGYGLTYVPSWLGTDVAEEGTNIDDDAKRAATYNNDWNPITTGPIWTRAYDQIKLPNSLLAHIDSEKIKWDSKEQKNRIKGNALFFRSWFYFNLVQAYGDVPLLTEPVYEPRTDYVRTPKKEVISQIVTDLIEAVNILPEEGERKGEFGKGAAQHLLTNVYLYDYEWEKAEQMATDLISGGIYHLMTERYGVEADEPGTPFTDMFIEGNVNRWEGNMEIIYSLQAANKNLTSGRGHFLSYWTPRYDFVDGMTMSMEYFQRGVDVWRPSEYFLNLFDPDYKYKESFYNPSTTDDRGSEFAIKTIWQFNDEAYIQAQKDAGTPLTQVVNGKTVEVKVGDTVVHTIDNWDNLYPAVTKFYSTMGTNLSESSSSKDWPLMRLAETYLFRAEARFNQGDLSGAAKDINELRKRAHAPEISAEDIDIDLILDERARELFGEGPSRRFTLMRTGKLIERNKLYNIPARDNISEKHKLYPIPQVEIDRMKDSPNFPQNPGW